MIKHGLKSYFKNLKYFFMTIGTLSIGIVFGVSIFIENTISTASNLVEGVADVINRTSIDVAEIKEYLSNTILALNWDEPFEALYTLINLDFIKQVFDGLINLMSSDLAPYASELDLLVNNAVFAVVTDFVMMLSLIGLSLFCGYYLTRLLIRKNMAKRSFWKTVLSVILDALISIALFLICTWLTILWVPSAIISVFAVLIIFGSISLIKAYLLHAKDKVPFKKVLNIKNVLSLLATNILIFLITMLVSYIITLLTNIITGIYVGIGLFEVGLIVINLNAESYVISYTKNISQTLATDTDTNVVIEVLKNIDSAEKGLNKTQNTDNKSLNEIVINNPKTVAQKTSEKPDSSSAKKLVKTNSSQQKKAAASAKNKDTKNNASLDKSKSKNNNSLVKK